MGIDRKELEKFFNRALKPNEFKDYCPNGLQIEGRKDIKNIAFAVSATLDSIEKAIEMRANALVVHHGLFWNHQGSKTLTGPFGRRVISIAKQHINLFGYHLPLDAHPEIGNAKSLANLIGVTSTEPFGDYKGSPTGVKGILATPSKASELQEVLKIVLKHDVILASPGPEQEIKSIGIITGGANSDWWSKLQGVPSGVLLKAESLGFARNSTSCLYTRVKEASYDTSAELKYHR